ncbi:hypothetical protein HK098_006816 [Nowakowskiella sp. JEL0407]|nr:hypothetical protein HK098_006816 [Nowakowskiella sp. JEL0407]
MKFALFAVLLALLLTFVSASPVFVARGEFELAERSTPEEPSDFDDETSGVLDGEETETGTETPSDEETSIAASGALDGDNLEPGYAGGEAGFLGEGGDAPSVNPAVVTGAIFGGVAAVAIAGVALWKIRAAKAKKSKSPYA